MLNTEEIHELIALKQEGNYWDFKKQWYVENHEEDLLHDIICMANNLANRDAYIIIGVDEEHGYCVNDISTDPYRKNTQKIIDFLGNKKFAGDKRPIVTVEYVYYEHNQIDVIIIHNSTDTPYYLKERFRRLQAGNIYTRIQDTNTPVDCTADDYQAEYLWRKRFGMLLSPLDKMKLLLRKKEQWIDSPVYDNVKYYKFSPEYTIQYSYEDPENRDGYEFYFLNQTDHSPSWTTIELKYHQTVLDVYTGIFLDGGRHFSSVPEWDIVRLDCNMQRKVMYVYWIADSLNYIIHDFYYNSQNQEAVWSNQRLMDNVLLFSSDEEHEQFNQFVSIYWDYYGSIIFGVG